MQSYNVRDQLDTDVQYVTQLNGQSDRLHVNVTHVVNRLKGKHVAFHLFAAKFKDVTFAQLFGGSTIFFFSMGQ